MADLTTTTTLPGDERVRRMVWLQSPGEELGGEEPLVFAHCQLLRFRVEVFDRCGGVA